jgi:hypothetical protein
MIQVELLAGEPAAAILAGALIARIYIVATESHLPLRNTVIRDQKHDPRNPDDMVY